VRYRCDCGVSGSEIVKMARLRAGLTQAEVASRCGTTQSAIARIERGGSEPSILRVESIARACGFDVNVSITPIDTNEEETFRRNLLLSPEQRMQRVVNAGRFILAGRSAIRSAKAGVADA
jgi:transcriptional regulator with XRE-family HTH domain